MNVETKSKSVQVTTTQQNQNIQQQVNISSGEKFSDELKELSAQKENKTDNTQTKDCQANDTPHYDNLGTNESQNTENSAEKNNQMIEQNTNPYNSSIASTIDGLKETFDEINKLNHTNDKINKDIKISEDSDEILNKKEEINLIDNNINIPEAQEKIQTQMNNNMNFGSNEQPFSEFVNNTGKQELKSSAKDIAEESEILSTMEENIALANKNMIFSKTKSVSNEEGIKKVQKDNNITVETIVKYDSIIMDKADVDFFVKLTLNNELDINEIQKSNKSARISKTLAEMLVKSMNENKPIRIDFDNNISVIIKISRDGKISADFLPSSNVAEAYLKENLPLLRQRFDDNNIDYNELNQRKQQKQDSRDNKKKGGKDE